MTNIEKVRHTFANCETGTIFSTSEIKDMVILKHGGNRGSIIPSDYCYNLTNKGKIEDPVLAKFNIFEWISRGNINTLVKTIYTLVQSLEIHETMTDNNNKYNSRNLLKDSIKIIDYYSFIIIKI